MKKVIALSFTTLFFISSIANSQAMGSGDKYSDLQTGVSYGIFKPTSTLGLSELNFEVRPCRLFPKKEEYLLVGFGGMDRGISIVQTSATYNCVGLDNPTPIGSIVINGMKAKIGIYCKGTKCTANNISEHGGEITFTTPKTKNLGPTFIRVGTQGGFTLKQLTTFAKGLKLVGKN